jgi:hypothetical protein
MELGETVRQSSAATMCEIATFWQKARIPLSPGAMHHARWMSKVLYSLKIWLFRAQFKLTPREENGLRDVCVCHSCVPEGVD